ncbi:HNH endonuclease [Acinetobacter haemolyticus]|uniref:HNH endonuclease n=1 Tax=Acinetobacter haemolyticus TaxID=29430 RepID=UPI000E577958|nr:HNH endonuclease [Acinetobacter haemolyticus]QDJ91862.1 hypothetical protein AhaeAN54_007090 [Acinetobacter haemolyticus]
MDRDKHWKEHEASVAKAERVRGLASTKGFKDKAWKAAVVEYVSQNSFCEDCKRRGYVSIAEMVGHKINPNTDRVLFWDKNNWQSLCKPCHTRLIADMQVVVPEPIYTTTDLYLIED